MTESRLEAIPGFRCDIITGIEYKGGPLWALIKFLLMYGICLLARVVCVNE